MILWVVRFEVGVFLFVGVSWIDMEGMFVRLMMELVIGKVFFYVVVIGIVMMIVFVIDVEIMWKLLLDC